jgi:SAM-dependent methyltransferase
MRWGPEHWDAWTTGTAGRECAPSPSEEALIEALHRVPGRRVMTVADLGCGSGRLLPFLTRQFARVIAVDYAPASLALARRVCVGKDVTFRRRDLRDLAPFRNSLDVAVAVRSIVGPRPEDADRILAEIHRSLVEGGLLAAIVPAATAGGKMLPLRLAGDPSCPAMLGFHEIEAQYRLRRAGFQGVRIRRFDELDGGPGALLCTATRRADN